MELCVNCQMCQHVPLPVIIFNKNHQSEDLFLRNYPGSLTLATLSCFLYEMSDNRAGKNLERSVIFLHSRLNDNHHTCLSDLSPSQSFFKQHHNYVLILVLYCPGYCFVFNLPFSRFSYHKIIILNQFDPRHKIFSCLTLYQMFSKIHIIM